MQHEGWLHCSLHGYRRETSHDAHLYQRNFVCLCVQNMVHYDYLLMLLHTRMFDSQVQISHNIKSSLSTLIVPVAHQYVYRQYYLPLISVDRIQYVLLIQTVILWNQWQHIYGYYTITNDFSTAHCSIPIVPHCWQSSILNRQIKRQKT